MTAGWEACAEPAASALIRVVFAEPDAEVDADAAVEPVAPEAVPIDNAPPMATAVVKHAIARRRELILTWVVPLSKRGEVA